MAAGTGKGETQRCRGYGWTAFLANHWAMVIFYHRQIAELGNHEDRCHAPSLILYGGLSSFCYWKSTSILFDHFLHRNLPNDEQHYFNLSTLSTKGVHTHTKVSRLW